MRAKPIRLGFSARFQIGYCLVMVAVTACASGLLYLLMDKSLSGGYLQSLRTLHYLDQNLSFYLSIMVLLQTLFVLFLTLLIVLLVSHQIAGPVFRYESVLENMQKGMIPKSVATRSNDQLKSTVDSLNGLSDYLRRVYESAGELKKQLDENGENLAAIDPVIVRQKISTVRTALGRFRAGEKEA